MGNRSMVDLCLSSGMAGGGYKSLSAWMGRVVKAQKQSTSSMVHVDIYDL